MYRKVDTVFPCTIDTITLIPSEDSEDSEDDTLITPTASNTAISQSIMDDKVIIDENTLSLLAPVSTELDISESTKIEQEQEENSSLPSLIFMIRDELKRAFIDTDEKIEEELTQSRYNMIQAIHARPRFKYY